MKRVVKEGPQLTGAQALDALIATLKNRALRLDNSELGSYSSGVFTGLADTLELIKIIRAEKFDDPATEEPLKVLGESKSYAL